ncbi:hypothetical protein ODR87_21800 [Escherichia coli]|nr:hypothetical protein [Escherichia coli]MCV8233603.1 hypothetical protein [Escherichia coli]MCV8243189.1 hypothetical protein [Escherichia coli]
MKGQKQFYLLQCSPHFHQSVLLQLSRSGIAYYNPVIRTFYKRRDCSAYRGQIMPMFPGYVFVLLDFEVEKIAIEISFKRGRRISDSGFVQYLIKKYKSQAMKELIHGADIPDE